MRICLLDEINENVIEILSNANLTFEIFAENFQAGRPRRYEVLLLCCHSENLFNILPEKNIGMCGILSVLMANRNIAGSHRQEFPLSSLI